MLIKCKFCVFEVPLTQANLDLHRDIIPFGNQDDPMVKNLHGSFEVGGPISAIVTKLKRYAMNLYERAHYERYLVPGQRDQLVSSEAKGSIYILKTVTVRPFCLQVDELVFWC